jgi:glycosyltransferase involved in cell wall biosynthesis
MVLRWASEALGKLMIGIATQDDPPLISALVCTCSRDRLVANTVSSILANTHPNFELIVVDQSKDNETREALRPFTDRRLKYLKSATIGKGNALNVGLRETRGAVVAITDDDCRVPGPGSRFPSGDDRDVAIRALLASYHVYKTSSISVTHFGFRTWQQGRQLARRDFLAIGRGVFKIPQMWPHRTCVYPNI